MLTLTLRSAALLFALAAAAATAEPPARDEPRPSRVQHSRETLAIAYPEDDEVAVKLRGTHRLPGGKGHAEVERKRGATQIKIELDKMKSAAEFGGDYNTFVLWTVSPEGQVVNAGEFVLDGDESKLEVSTPMRTFAMVVTAEPHFAVKVPSRFVVLENTQPEDDVEEIRIVALGFDGAPTRYAYDRETLAAAPQPDGDQRTELRQARTAIAIAERAGAARFAMPELERARENLENARAAADADRDKEEIRRIAHNAIRQASEAQDLAERRSFQAALAQEREARASEMRALEADLQSATTEAEKAHLQAKKREIELQMQEDARLRTEQQLAQTVAEKEQLSAEKNQLRAESQAQQEKLRAEAARLRSQQRAQARRAAATPQLDRDAAAGRLRSAVGQLAQPAPQGLLITLPDGLFEQAALRPEAREVVSRLAGILLASPGFKISIEGSAAAGQGNATELAQQRAANVHRYFANAGVAESLLTLRKPGDPRPASAKQAAASGVTIVIHTN
ncbi:MAG: OmpA family protein [Candidatus Acidiferrales bacterium]